jgi:exopolyphosphatase/guanosine-5'-triphosphate,3'-diphosphate pyrophosphatase
LKLAAIDIGSNAARLLITDVIEGIGHAPEFIKIDLIRVPLRLGFDVFETGKISEIRTKMIMDTMKAYHHLLNVYEVKHLIACATSAMRDAKNSEEIIAKVTEETGRRS